MRAIVAVDKNWGIGKKNALLFSIPEDMKFFRQTTLNKVVVMGRKTLESFPGGKPLKNRTNVVLSSNLKREDCTVVNGVSDLLCEIKRYSANDVFVIGGAMLYKTLLPYCSEVLVTKVEADGEAEVFFENLDERSDWECASVSDPVESNGFVIRFTTYKNLNLLEF